MTQRVVHALDCAGAPVELLACSVLPGREEVGIGTVAVGVDQAAPVGFRQRQGRVEFSDPIPTPVPATRQRTMLPRPRRSSAQAIPMVIAAEIARSQSAAPVRANLRAATTTKATSTSHHDAECSFAMVVR